jgi:2-phospho-L-lactate transferase/gluconeogenesis factor (CofD/UPF0052 family)
VLDVVVIGGGAGLYPILSGLRDQSRSLTAVISGLPPGDDASVSLAAMAPPIEENAILRGLLAHRMESRGWRGAHFAAGLLLALEETQGSRQAALDAAGDLLGIRGRVAIALADDGSRGMSRWSAAEAIACADMVVIAPGNLEHDVMPVICCPGMIPALQRTTAVKVLVSAIQTTVESAEATASPQALALTALTDCRFDAVLADRPEGLADLLLEVAAASLGRRAEQAS